MVGVLVVKKADTPPGIPPTAGCARRKARQIADKVSRLGWGDNEGLQLFIEVGGGVLLNFYR
jgi:hypothetical protein